MAEDVQIFRGPKPPTPPKKTAPSMAPAALGVGEATKKEAPLVTSEAVEIHTMKEDIAALATKKLSSPSGASISQGAAIPVNKKAFPLPVKSPAGKSIVMPPSNPQKKPRTRRLAIVALGTLVVVVGGIIAGSYILQRSETITSNDPPIINPQELIPASAMTVTEYRFDTEERRQAITDFWAKQTGQQPDGIAALLQGDPRVITQQSTATSVFYVTLLQETTPFVVVKQTRETQDMFASGSGGTIVTKGGWYIAHQSATDPYMSALSQGNIADQDAIQAFSEGYAMRVYLNEVALGKITNQVTSKKLVGSPLSQITLISDLPSGNILSLKGLGKHVSPQAGTISSPDSIMLNLVPPNAAFIRTGYNFGADASALIGVNPPLLDPAVAQEPAVSQLISQLSQSYTYFQRPAVTSASSTDHGLIIRLPLELKQTLVLGDQTLEKALFALAPLIIGSGQPTPLIFNDGTLDSVLLRYVNLAGTDKAIDYTIFGDYLLIGTSKDGMAALISAVKSPSAPTGGVVQAVHSLSGTSTSQSVIGASLGAESMNLLIPGIQAAPIGAVGVKAVEGQSRSLEAKIIF